MLTELALPHRLQSCSPAEAKILVKQYLQQICANALNVEATTLDSTVEFFSFGLDSVKVVDIFHEISAGLNLEIEPSVFFDYPTIESLAEYISGLLTEK